jgi:hypothetical protein
MEKPIPLKPNWTLLEKYGYDKNSTCFGLSDIIMDTEVDKIHSQAYYLNNIPGDPKIIMSKLRMCANFNNLGDATDTFIFICLELADWYYLMVNKSYEKQHKAKSVQELANFIMQIKNIAFAEAEITLHKKKKLVAKIAQPENLRYIENALVNLLKSSSFFADELTIDELSFTIDNLSKLAILKAQAPRNLLHKLRTVYIAKLHEFISQDTILKTSKGKFTYKQRQLIYESGLSLGIFPSNHRGYYSDYIESIYRDNMALFERIKKKGRIDLF